MNKYLQFFMISILQAKNQAESMILFACDPFFRHNSIIFARGATKIFLLGIKIVQIAQLLRSATKEEILHKIKNKLNGQELVFADGNYHDKTWTVNVLKKIDLRINQILRKMNLTQLKSQEQKKQGIQEEVQQARSLQKRN